MIGDQDSSNRRRYLGKKLLPPAKDISLVRPIAYRGFLKEGWEQNNHNQIYFSENFSSDKNILHFESISFFLSQKHSDL